MNTLKNTVSLIGNLGKDPEVIEFQEGKKLVKFSIATNENYKNKNGEWIESTQWHSIIAWGVMADSCKNQLQKGNRIILEGKLDQDSYETKEGEKRYQTQVVLRQFMKLDRKPEEVKA